jgi:UrcA family protein
MAAALLMIAGLVMAPESHGTGANGSAAAVAPRLIVEAPRRLGADSQAVFVGDLALDQPSGRQQLVRRVGMAISTLCDPARFSIADPAGRLRCTQAAWQDVQPRIAALTR